MNQYLLVHCHQYALLVDTSLIVEVLSLNELTQQQSVIVWRDDDIPLLNLSQIFAGNSVQISRDCLVLNIDDGINKHIALGVGEVSNIEAINEEDFDEIPSLAFPYNDYFDKAYIHPQTQQCIYRLRPQVLLKHVME